MIRTSYEKVYMSLAKTYNLDLCKLTFVYNL